MKKSESQILGRQGEKLILNIYQKNNYSLVAQNFQFYSKNSRGRLGEIDLILQKDNRILVLVEVKTRSNQKFGHPVEQINHRKIKHLYRSYQYFLQKFPNYSSFFCRFDVATILSDQVKIITNAYNFDSF